MLIRPCVPLSFPLRLTLEVWGLTVITPLLQTDVASDTRYLSGVSTSGASDYSSRVRNIVGLYEARDSTGSGSASAAASSPATDADGVRLTQYGFGEEGGVQQQQH